MDKKEQYLECSEIRDGMSSDERNVYNQLMLEGSVPTAVSYLEEGDLRRLNDKIHFDNKMIVESMEYNLSLIRAQGQKTYAATFGDGTLQIISK